MKELYSPNNETELMIIRSILDSERIDYRVLNDNFGSMEVGPLPIRFFNAKMIMVEESQFETAKELLTDYLEKTGGGRESGIEEYSLCDKVRMAVEALLFDWIMPGRKRRDKR